METNKCIKESFVVIGKEGSTNDGTDFIQKLWADANGHFGEVAQLAKKDEKGNIVGVWGGNVGFFPLVPSLGGWLLQGIIPCRGGVCRGCGST